MSFRLRDCFTLPFYEYVVVGIFCFVLLALSWNSARNMNEPIYDGSHYFSKKIITVSVKGEVEAPGDYKIAQGTSVKEILEMAKPTERADLKKINLSRKLTRQNTIKIPSKKKTVSKPL